MDESVNILTKRAGEFSPYFTFILCVLCWSFNQKETHFSQKSLKSESDQSPQSLCWSTARVVRLLWLPGTGTCQRASFWCNFSSVIRWQALAASREVSLTPSPHDTVLQQTVPKGLTRESARSTSAIHLYAPLPGSVLNLGFLLGERNILKSSSDVLSSRLQFKLSPIFLIPS